MKALILSAGFGTRLRPITHHIPKPLVPVGPLTLLDFHIQTLLKKGIKGIVINVHHLHTKVRKHIQKSYSGKARIHVIHEKNILGTGGAIKNAEKILSDGPFLVVNSDIIHDFDIPQIIRSHRASGAIATMVCKHTSRSFLQRVKISRKKEVVSIGAPVKGESGKRHLFTGIHVIEPEILSFIPEKTFCCINSDVYRNLIKNGRSIHVCMADGYWHDVGLPRSYYQACRDFLNGKLPRIFYSNMKGKHYKKDSKNIKAPSFIARDSLILKDAVVGPYAVALSNSCLPEKASLERAILLPGTKLKKGEKILKQIRYKSLSLSVSRPGQ